MGHLPFAILTSLYFRHPSYSCTAYSCRILQLSNSRGTHSNSKMASSAADAYSLAGLWCGIWEVELCWGFRGVLCGSTCVQPQEPSSFRSYSCGCTFMGDDCCAVPALCAVCQEYHRPEAQGATAAQWTSRNGNPRAPNVWRMEREEENPPSHRKDCCVAEERGNSCCRVKYARCCQRCTCPLCCCSCKMLPTSCCFGERSASQTAGTRLVAGLPRSPPMTSQDADNNDNDAL